MALKRVGSAHWTGEIKEGKGSITTKSGALTAIPYSFATRFLSEDGKAGTNPEELLAAAHAACFTMAVSFILGNAGFIPRDLKTQATVLMDNPDGGFQIKEIILDLDAEIPHISDEEFQKLVHEAKVNCPVSKALAVIPINLSARLK